MRWIRPIILAWAVSFCTSGACSGSSGSWACIVSINSQTHVAWKRVDVMCSVVSCTQSASSYPRLVTESKHKHEISTGTNRGRILGAANRLHSRGSRAAGGREQNIAKPTGNIRFHFLDVTFRCTCHPIGHIFGINSTLFTLSPLFPSPFCTSTPAFPSPLASSSSFSSSS